MKKIDFLATLAGLTLGLMLMGQCDVVAPSPTASGTVYAAERELNGKARKVEVEKKTFDLLETSPIHVPTGPDDEPCRAYWRMRIYQGHLDKFREQGLKDAEFEKKLRVRIVQVAEGALRLLKAKQAVQGSVGCGGEYSDYLVLSEVEGKIPKPRELSRLSRNK